MIQGSEPALPSQLLDYSDYHRTVIGFHGTTAESADRLVAGQDFEASDRADEWFGKGIYFWEHAFKQAWWWARDHKKYSEPAIIGAVIRLGNCFDLLDPGNVSVLRWYLGEMVANLRAAGLKIPRNVRSGSSLDCTLFNYFFEASERAGRPLDSARAAYIPTTVAKRICKGSWISEETHIQVCVRNPASILAVWHVREDGRYGKPARR